MFRRSHKLIDWGVDVPDESIERSPSSSIPGSQETKPHMCKQLDSFQQQLITMLNNGKNVIVAWSPSAGKTRPIFCWWLDRFNKAMTEIFATLARERSIENIPRDMVLSLVEQAVNKIGRIVWLVPIKQLLEEKRADFAKLMIETIRQYVPNYRSGSFLEGAEFVSTLGANQNTGSPIRTPITVAIYESFAQNYSTFVKQLNIAIVVFDEFQEVFLNPQRDIKKATFMMLKDIAPLAKQNTRVVFLTGSLATEDISILQNLISTAYFPVETSVVDIPNRSHLVVVADPDIRNPRRIKEWIESGISNVCCVLFSRHAIDSYVERFIREIKPDQNVFRERVTVGTQTYSVRDLLPSLPSKYRETVLRRFGYIYRDLSDEFMQSIPVIQALFAQGIIRFMFATDAIGKGVTLRIYHLILPYVEKGSQRLSGSDIIQLVHRAGRDPQRIACIYCHPDDYDFVVKAALGARDMVVTPILTNENSVNVGNTIVKRGIRGLRSLMHKAGKVAQDRVMAIITGLSRRLRRD